MARTQLQIDASKELRMQLRVYALSQGLTLREYVLQAIAKDANPKIRKMIDMELQEANRRKQVNK